MARYFGCESYSDRVGSCRFAGHGAGNLNQIADLKMS